MRLPWVAIVKVDAGGIFVFGCSIGGRGGIEIKARWIVVRTYGAQVEICSRRLRNISGGR